MAESTQQFRHASEKLKRLASQGWEWGRHIYQEFTGEHASLTAAAIALFGILSIFPLALLAISMAAYALGSQEEALRQIEQVAGQLLVGDASRTLTSVLRGVVESRGIAGFVGLIGFLWAASRVFTIMAEAFNMAWDVPESRGFFKRNLLAIGLVLLSLIFGMLMFVGPLAVSFLLRYGDRVAAQVGAPTGISAFWPALVTVLAFIATIAFFFILYKYVPNRPVPWQSALAGAITAAVLWEIARYLFQLYVVNFASYNEVYGALAGAIILILWLYYSAMILLLGAVTSAVHDARVFHDRAEHPQRRGYTEFAES